MAWLQDWKKRIKITVDNTNIDSNLTHFPIQIFLGTSVGQTPSDVSCVFDELTSDDNRKKIAVTKADGETQLYVEIEQWDDANEKAVLHCGITGDTLSGSADTDYYLYYDSAHVDNDSYVGDTNDVVSESVWDSNFKGVWHMADGASTSAIYDSTSNDNDATKKAANEPIEETGKIGNSQLFDGVNDYGKITNVVIASPSELTISGWIKKGSGGTTYETAFHQGTIYSIGSSSYWFGVCVSNYLTATIGANTGAGWAAGKTTTIATVGQWYFIAAVWNGSVVKVYLDGAYNKQYNLASYNNGITPTRFGSSIDATGNYKFGGSVDEVRISDTARSDDWIKANYYSQEDDLLTFGSEENKIKQTKNYILRFG